MKVKILDKKQNKVSYKYYTRLNFTKDELSIAEMLINQVSKLATPEKEETFVKLVFENYLHSCLRKAA